jgi:prepilin peptidase dependent protein B
MLKAQQGLSLIELMVALLVGSILIVGVLAVTATTLKESARNLQKQRLQYELQSAMNNMIADIRRAGYWANASSQMGTNTNSNPFMTTANLATPSSNCILLSYDINSNSSLPTVNSGSDDERYGYRLSNNAIQARITNGTYNCTANAGWVNITDPLAITVTQLNFVISAPTTDIDGSGTDTSTLTERQVDITLTAQLINDATVSTTLNQTVRVYNDLFTP